MRFKHFLKEQIHNSDVSFLEETFIGSKNDASVRMYGVGRGVKFIRHIITASKGELLNLTFNPKNWKLMTTQLKKGGIVKDDNNNSFEVELKSDIIIFESKDFGKIKLSASAIADMEESILYQLPNIPKGSKMVPPKPRFTKTQLKSFVSFSK
jgi:hypothetical protein